MIIGIDVSSVPYNTGVSNYTINLVRQLVKNNKSDTFKLFYSSLRLPLPKEIKILKNYSRVRIYSYRLPPTLLQILWNKLHIFPIEFFIGKCDIFHTSDWTQPPTLNAKTITTVHDLVPFLFPQFQDPKVIDAHKNKMFWARQHCYHFICVSQSTRSDLLKLFPEIDKSKVSVIYEAAEDKYEAFNRLTSPVRNKKKQIINVQYGLNRFILAQGTREPRKNLARLIEAFHCFKQKHPANKTELAITGKYGWGPDVVKFKDPSIKILGFIPEEDMVALHASAVCLVYPSLYEGFGLPLVKSMKVGTPVITSNSSSLPEVVGDAALLIDPNSTESIETAIENIITLPKLRKSLIAKGILRSKMFSWEITAQNTYKTYLNVYNSDK